MESTPIQKKVIDEIARFSSRKFRLLTLPPPLEERFERDTGQKRAMHLWREGLIAIVLFDLFAFADFFICRNTSWNTVIWRIGVITPLALLVNTSMRWKPEKIYRELSVALVVCMAGLTHLHLESGRDVASSAYAQAGVIIAILIANVVLRLHFSYALAVTAVLTAGEVVFLRHDHFLNPAEKSMGMVLVVLVVIITMLANYSFGRDLRLVYLMLLRNEIQSEELAFVNAELHRISSRDNLTGLANRHSFELHCEKLWQQAVSDGVSLSAVLIDIDKFKSVNDFRGHFYGDKVLTRVASLLQQSLRGKDDFAARFGGEEFVVLLPETDQRAAIIVAERIRKMVEVAGSPAVEDLHALPIMSTTVSCGVATCLPGENCCIMDLLKAADKALYQAKRSGRNRVCYSAISASTAAAQEVAQEIPVGRIAAQSDSAVRATAPNVLWG